MPDGTVTAGNSSGLNDGAAALLLASVTWPAMAPVPGLRWARCVPTLRSVVALPPFVSTGGAGLSAVLLAPAGARLWSAAPGVEAVARERTQVRGDALVD